MTTPIFDIDALKCKWMKIHTIEKIDIRQSLIKDAANHALTRL